MNLYGDNGPLQNLGPLPDFKGGSPIGFAELPAGKFFRCTDCEYMQEMLCKNKDSRLFNRPVNEHRCCNLFDTAGMELIV